MQKNPRNPKIMDYKGTIIEESLENADALKGVKILKTDIEPATENHKTPWIKQWTLHRVEIPENRAEAVAQALSRVIDVGHVSSWYADFKNDADHYIIYRDKVFHIKRKDKAAYDEVRRYALMLGISDYQLVSYHDLPVDVLANFLNEANKQAYANKDAPKAPSSRAGSEDYHFEKDDLMFHDTYFGGRDFIGEEIVYVEGRPAWGINYYGFVLKPDVDEKELYDFLRQALMADNPTLMPVRGLDGFSSGDWAYRFSAEGKLRRFSGQEKILLKGEAVYQCWFHGGYIE
jgi:hypothetical protein